MDASNGKKAVRQAMRLRRREIAPDCRRELSAAVCRRVLEREDVRAAVSNARVFAVYLASADEIDLSALVRVLWANGCRIAVPAWRDGSYRLVEYAPETRLISGPMGILEPEVDGETLIDENEVGVWIVPGLAFSRSGARLGYGGGWYDRFLERAAPEAVMLGVAYPFQLVDVLPTEPHDRSLTGVVIP